MPSSFSRRHEEHFDFVADLESSTSSNSLEGMAPSDL